MTEITPRALYDSIFPIKAQAGKQFLGEKTNQKVLTSSFIFNNF